MPGHLRSDYAHLGYAHQQDDPLLTGPLSPSALSPLSTPAQSRRHVQFIPSQMDPLSATTTRAARESPLRLFIKDAGVLFTMLGWLPWVFLPFRTSNPNAELYLNLANLKDMVLQGVLFGWETMFLLLAFPAFLTMPGITAITLATCCCIFVLGLARLEQGPRFAYSKMDEATKTGAKQHEHERWLFINGIATGHSGLQKNIDLLSKTFGRPVIGVHNKTYGMIADILECLIQRDFFYNTMDVRVTYEYLKACLCDPTIRKIVLVAHSQGGIVATMALDHLFADLPREVFSKLELYTFGSAASHCNNPLSLSLSSSPKDVSQVNKQRYIYHIEHYCNEYDLVARWGPLYNIAKVLDNRYCGTIFVRVGATGHLFNQHYLDVMFPLASTSKREHINGVSNGISKLENMANAFLDTVVDVNESLARKREDMALSNMGIMRRDSGAGQWFKSSEENVVDLDALMDGKVKGRKKGEVGIEVLNGGDGIGKESRGKSVRELSRLWLYLGGRSPKD